MFDNFYFTWDWTYLLVIAGAVLGMIASAKVKSSFNKYSKVRNSRGITGAQAARMILDDAGVTNVVIERVSGNLTDHYSSSEKVLRLSDSVYDSASVAAVGVAAHECGHAIQDKEAYGPLRLRAISVPAAKVGSWLSFPIVIIGIILGMTGLARVGVALFMVVVFFQLITLPVEFNASSRALAILDGRGILDPDEMKGAKKVLSAAAMTYVAALVSALLTLLRLILLTRRRD